MESFSLYVVAAVALLLLSASPAQGAENDTLDFVFRQKYNESIFGYSYRTWQKVIKAVDVDKKLRNETKIWQRLAEALDKIWLELYGKLIYKHSDAKQHEESSINNIYWKEYDDSFQVVLSMQYKIMMEFGDYLGKVTVKSLLKDLNVNCSRYLKTPINNLTVEPRLKTQDYGGTSKNVTCVTLWLVENFTFNWERAIKMAVKKLSYECNQKLLPFCHSGTKANCTMDYQKQFGDLLWEYILELKEVAPFSTNLSSPIEIIKQLLKNYVQYVTLTYVLDKRYFDFVTNIISSVSSIEPFSYENVIFAGENREIRHVVAKTRKTSSWSIITSDSGSVDHPCSTYMDIYKKNTKYYKLYVLYCNSVDTLQSHAKFVRCLNNDQYSAPLAWSTFPSSYFHSQCLCFAYNGTDCGVQSPPDVDPRLYCISVLLRDLQRQVTVRPAVTYLDYAYMTKFPVFQVIRILQLRFRNFCAKYYEYKDFRFVLSLQCFFSGLVNKKLNCSEPLLINSYNSTLLCGIKNFVSFVIDDYDEEGSAGYHFPGDSGLVQGLTYADVSVRLLTLVTYLSCPPLRNLPGKVLIGYQVTALLRLLVVRASLEDLALAVRLDVAFDLASTLWLTAYLHFLTSSINTLRLPDSLTREEARMVLLRYSLLGWALPAALSASFFSMDEAIESYVQFGQILFVLCNYSALLWNLYMFYHNCLFYYDVKKNAVPLKPGTKARTVFTGLFIFALKTSVLSGAGITVRLIFTQIQGLEQLLGYYHAVGTLQALLVFILYGCNREARDFWRRVFFGSARQCLLQRNTHL